jgi:hypothetical protein
VSYISLSLLETFAVCGVVPLTVGIRRHSPPEFSRLFKNVLFYPSHSFDKSFEVHYCCHFESVTAVGEKSR